MDGHLAGNCIMSMALRAEGTHLRLQFCFVEIRRILETNYH
jgi:hypothetical protein